MGKGTSIQFSNDMVKVTFNDGRTIDITLPEFRELTLGGIRWFGDIHPNNQSEKTLIFRKNGKKIKAVISRNLRFWQEWEKNTWEPNTFALLDRYLTKDHTFIDVGAWIGPIVLYGAQLAKTSFAFEPDPMAFLELELNVQANRTGADINSLTILDSAIGSENGTVMLGNRNQWGDSTSSFQFSEEQLRCEVRSVRLDDFIRTHEIQGKIFIKIDIEGGEYDIIPGLKKLFTEYDIELYLSLHPQYLNYSLNNRNTGISLLQRIINRFVFTYKHYKLIAALPFSYFYTDDGKLINLKWKLAEVFLIGRFPGFIFATNRKWQNSP